MQYSVILVFCFILTLLEAQQWGPYNSYPQYSQPQGQGYYQHRDLEQAGNQFHSEFQPYTSGNSQNFEHEESEQNNEEQNMYSETHEQIEGQSSQKSYLLDEPYKVVKTVKIPVIKQKTVSIPYTVPVPMPKPVVVPVAKPYPVQIMVPHAVPVPVVKTINFPVEKQVPVPVMIEVPYRYEKLIPMHVEVEKKYPIYVPVYKHVYVHSKPKHMKETKDKSKGKKTQKTHEN